MYLAPCLIGTCACIHVYTHHMFITTQGLSAYLIPSSPIDPSLMMDDSHINTTVWEENGNSQIHNPFDSGE